MQLIRNRLEKIRKQCADLRLAIVNLNQLKETNRRMPGAKVMGRRGGKSGVMTLAGFKSPSALIHSAQFPLG